MFLLKKFLFVIVVFLVLSELAFSQGVDMVLRKNLKEEDTWNINKMYDSLSLWKSTYQKLNESNEWKELTQYQNTIKYSPKNLLDTLKLYFNIERSVEKLFTFAHLLFDQDMGNDHAKEIFGLSQILLAKFQEKVAWIEPEILQLSQDQLISYLDDSSLKDYKFYLEKISRMKAHTLSVAEEELLARAEQTFQTPYKIFSSFENADLTFEKVRNSDDDILELTHGKFSSYIRDKDRLLRKEAFEKYHKRFMEFENTLCELIQGQIKNHEFLSKSRKFDNCLTAALFPNQIDQDVYLNLIKTVRKNLPTLHKFISFKKRILKLPEFRPYDIYAPLVQEVDFSMDLNEAKKVVIDSVSTLGEEYQNILKRGLTLDRWVDYFETTKKRSGAYSSGCYDSMPYILMNYYGTLNDINTLAHEAGHSMHSYLSHNNQKYQYASYPIFLAEVASTFNEQLLHNYLYSNTTDVNKRAYLIADSLDRIQATFFRQTLFAEFELKIHEIVESGSPLTPSVLKKIYHDLYQDYYGKDMVLDELIDIEWARVPHFYYNFYVYQYATGISAAIFLYNQVKNDKNHCQQYLNFLKSGGSRYPLDLLKEAGVDLTAPDAVESLIKYFDHLIDELSIILEK